MARMTTRRAVLVGILAGILVGIGATALVWTAADRNRQPDRPPAAATTTISPGATQPTIPPPPTVTALAAASSTVMATGKTTSDPDTFTTGTVPGPIQDPSSASPPKGSPARAGGSATRSPTTAPAAPDRCSPRSTSNPPSSSSPP